MPRPIFFRRAVAPVFFGVLAAAVAVIGLAVTPARAAIIYQTCGGSTLCTVDTDTGAYATVGSFGIGSTFGAAFDLNGTLYATTGTNSLSTVNLSTGAATVIGSLPTSAYAIDFDSTGRLYSLGTNGALYQLDKTTGGGTLIGNTGINATMDIAFDSHDNLFGVVNGNLYRIDANTGSVLGSIATSLGGSNMGIMFDQNDVLWATLYTSNSPLYTLNTTTGAATQVYSTGLGGPHGGDIYVASQAVPEPGLVALFGIAVGGLGLMHRRRRRG